DCFGPAKCILRIDTFDEAVSDLGERAGIAADCRLAVCKGLRERQPITFGERWKHDKGAFAVEQGEHVVALLIEDDDCVACCRVGGHFAHQVIYSPSDATDKHHAIPLRIYGS